MAKRQLAACAIKAEGKSCQLAVGELDVGDGAHEAAVDCNLDFERIILAVIVVVLTVSVDGLEQSLNVLVLLLVEALDILLSLASTLAGWAASQVILANESGA